jgi:hypothetical protein
MLIAGSVVCGVVVVVLSFAPFAAGNTRMSEMKFSLWFSSSTSFSLTDFIAT